MQVRKQNKSIVSRDLSIDVKMIVFNMFPIPILRFMVHILSHYKSIIVKIASMYVVKYYNLAVSGMYLIC